MRKLSPGVSPEKPSNLGFYRIDIKPIDIDLLDENDQLKLLQIKNHELEYINQALTLIFR